MLETFSQLNDILSFHGLVPPVSNKQHLAEMMSGSKLLTRIEMLTGDNVTASAGFMGEAAITRAQDFFRDVEEMLDYTKLSS